jgi:Golgi apparatus protein 1
MNQLARTIAALCSAALFTTAAVADEQQMRGDACRADVERLCKDVQVGEGRVANCLKHNNASVSAGCKEHMAKMRERAQERMQAFEQACKSDLDQYCKDVPRGQGKVMGCLRDHAGNLSASCKEQLSQIDARHQQMHTRMHGIGEACKSDVGQFCQGVQPGGGRLAQCLKTNQAKLSEPCKSALVTK